MEPVSERRRSVSMETLIALLIFCVVVGLILWLISYLPLPEPFGMVARVVVVLIALIYLLDRVGVFHGRL